MKKVFILVLLFLFLSGCSVGIQNNKGKESSPEPVSDDYVKSVWIAYYELREFLNGSNEKEFANKISDAFSEIGSMGFNSVTVQVRPCADAFYRSKNFPSSEYCFSTQGSDMPYDPLEIMCETAHKNNLRIEAWINPYRVSQNSDITKLCEKNIAKRWYYSSKKKRNVYITDKKIFFNPASHEVRRLIINGVKEIVQNYSVDAIHFDDYFYPTAKKDIDSREYKKYQKEGGKLTLADWRRENINKMIKGVYKAVKGINSKVKFGISPASDIENDKNVLYADVEKWVSDKEYIDYICPQIYFGFKNVYQPFMFTVKKWTYITDCDLYIGLPLYKANKYDKYAASENSSIRSEFINNDNIIARQIEYISKIDKIKGFYVFSYSYLKDENAKAEVENMLKVMQSINHP